MIEVVMCIVKNNNQLLLVHRKGKEEKLSWVFPGGTVEEGETIEQTAMRELKEETNINGKVEKIIGERIHPYTKKNMAYVALTPLTFDVKLGDDDLDDIKWIDINCLFEYAGNCIFEKVLNYLGLK